MAKTSSLFFAAFAALFSHVSNAYQTIALNANTTYVVENNGTWTMADWTGNGVADLVYIKTIGPATNRVEVHISSAESGFQQRTFARGTTYGPENNGNWMMGDFDGDGKPDLIYIKTRGTGTNSIEVHVASGASQFQTRIHASGSVFPLEDNGVYTMADVDGDGKLDLVYIKTRNTPSGKVEVHVATGASGYKTRIPPKITLYETAIASDGTWLMRSFTDSISRDLVFIDTRNTVSGRVEVYVADGARGYQSLAYSDTRTVFPEPAQNAVGTWLMAKYTGQSPPDLVYIQNLDTASKRVELRVSPYFN